MSNNLRLGFIGLGLMGKPMAGHLLKAGFPLTVHNRSQAAVDELIAAGAKNVPSPKQVAQNADIVFTCLPDSPDVEEIVLGKDGVVEGAREGLIVVDHSTIKPATARPETCRRVSLARRQVSGRAGQRWTVRRAERNAHHHGRRRCGCP